MCHGVAHRLGIADEDEADFAAFLACTHSDDKRFAYSGYCAAFETCYEALQTYCPDVAATYTDGADTMHTLVLNDIEAANAYYETYEGLFTRVGSIAKELYLRAFLSNAGKNLSDSTVSYLIAWHEATAAPQTANVDSGVNQ